MNTLEQLRGNGYAANESESGLQIGGADHAWYYRNPGDYEADIRTQMRDPTVTLAVLAFTAEGPSPFADRFIADLVKLVAPADRLLKKFGPRPLVRVTPTSVQAIYATEHHHVGLVDSWNRRLFDLGLRFTDRLSRCEAPAQLVANCEAVPLDGTWLNDATPLTVKREALPTWNSDEMSPKFRALVDRFIAASEIVECEPYREPVRDHSPVAQLARIGVGQAAPTDENPPPIKYADPRLARAFGANLTHPPGFWLDGKDEGGEAGSPGLARRRG